MAQKIIDDKPTYPKPTNMMAAIDDNFDELYGGTLMSHVSYYLSAPQSVADNTPTLVEIDTKIRDSLNEFNTTTHLFTATYARDYDVKVGMWTLISDWTVGDYIAAHIYKEGAQVQVRRAYAWTTSTQKLDAGVAFTVFLDVGETLAFWGTINRGAGSDISQGTTAFITIDGRP